MQTFDELRAFAQKHCTGPVESDANCAPKALRIDPQDLVPLCCAQHQDPATYFDMLSCITGIDNGPEAAMEVAYNLYSIPFDHHLMVKVSLNRENPSIDSISSIWRTAEWHEREVYDMFGISFNNHPDLRRILLPADWEGYPLRKDYKQQEYYRDIKVEY